MTDAEAPVPSPSAAPARPGRWRRRLLIALATLAVLWLLAPLVVSLPFVRGMVADRIGAKLDRKVEIGSASAWWWRGVDLEDITVHSPDGFDGPLATIRKVHADVDVLGALGGTLEARVRVVEPHVTFRRDGAGRSNADGVAEALRAEDDEASAREDTALDVEVVVIGGRIESLGAAGAVEAALETLDLGLTLRPSGELGVDLRCVAAGAGAEGGSARIAVAGRMLPDGSVPFSVDVPSLDLARLARLVEDATGVGGIAGTVEVKGEGARSAAGTFEGRLHAQGTNLRARTPGGTLVALRRLLATASMQAAEDATDVDADVQLADLEVRDPASAQAPFREPSIALAARARVHPKGWVRIAKARVEAGQTARVTVADDFKLQLEPSLRFDGQLAVEADLARIGALRGLVPALEPLGGGRLSAQVQGTGGQGLDMGIGAAVTNLSLRPSEAFPQGYLEPEIRTTLRVSRSEAEGSTLRIYRLASRLVTLTTRDAKDGVALGVDAQERFWLEGGFDGRLDLASLSRLLAASLPLEPGERIAGTVVLGADGRGSGESMQLSGDVTLRDVVVPPSWSSARTPATLTARVAMRRERGRTTAEVTGLDGMGLGGELSLRLREEAAGGGLDELEGQLALDFARARGWLGPLAGLEPAARLAGVARTRLRMAPEAGGHRLDATVQVSDLQYQATPADARLDEPRVTLRADAWIAPEGGRHRAEELKLTTRALELDASGSSAQTAPETDVDLALRIGGDAAALAPTIAAFLGEDYRDLRGEGRLAGTVKATGSPADHAAALRLDGNLILGSWTTSGLQVGELKATLARAEVADPLSMGVTSRLNGGRFFAQGTVVLGQAAKPWKGQLDLGDVDTSGVLTSQGVGRLLAFALPALLPAGANVPVLSGRLTARVEAEAPSLEAPASLDGLTGRGRITMAEGQIRDSTLFGGGGGGGGLAQVIGALKVAVPDAGRILEGATKALTFSTLDSKFHVAQRVVTVDRAKLSGNTLDVDLRGRVTFEQRVDLEGKLVLLGSAGEKVGKVLPGGAVPVRIVGTLDTPVVRPNVDLRALLAGAVADPQDLLDRLRKKGLPDIKNPFK